MDHKKKYYIFSLVLLFGMLFATFSICYASGPAYTPINEMTPEIAQEIFDYYKNNNSFNYTNNATQNTYNNFYSQLNSEKLQNFCDVWNSRDFSNCADYIEQCVFMIYGYNNKCFLKVFFNNNGIGNSSNHFKMDIQAYKFICYYRDDNNNNITGSADHWVFNDTGVLSYSWRETISTSGTSLNYNQETSNFTTYNLDSQLFESKVICAYHLNQSIFLKPRTKSDYYWYLLNGNSILDYIPIPTPTPEPTPSVPITGTITNNSGEKTGSIDLSGIQNSLGNIDNTTTQIEQNTQTIIQQQQQIQEGMTTPPDMSETEIDPQDITQNIDFGLINNNSTLNGYTNFWLTLTNGLRGALTGNVRSIDINFRGKTYTINLNDFSIQLPQQLKFILGMVSTIYFVILIVKWWKIIIDKITGGDIDEVLAMNEEERHCRFVLGGV